MLLGPNFLVDGARHTKSLTKGLDKRFRDAIFSEQLHLLFGNKCLIYFENLHPFYLIFDHEIANADLLIRLTATIYKTDYI